MKRTIESIVKNGLRKFGIDVTYVNNNEGSNPELYRNTLRGAISVVNPFNIIQVGANDGKHNDPIYKFVKQYKEITNIILVEPNEMVIPHLEENYSYHPSSEIINKAIGGKDSSSFIQFYTVDQAYWDDINATYGDDWPDYRIPTGVTTTDKNQLLRWISKNVDTKSDPEEVVKKSDVEIISPNSIINESRILNDVHLLQVDTEGMDDEIVYSFIEQNIRPNIINIETKHLSQQRQQKYDKRLRNEGYKIYNYDLDEKLALKTFAN